MSLKSKKHNHYVSLAILLVVLSVMYVLYSKARDSAKIPQVSAPKIDGVVFNKPIKIKSFTLTDTNNKSFTNANLNGHWTLMFFWFY